jgi:hypothetical protein
VLCAGYSLTCGQSRYTLTGSGVPNSSSALELLVDEVWKDREVSIFRGSLVATSQMRIGSDTWCGGGGMESWRIQMKQRELRLVDRFHKIELSIR